MPVREDKYGALWLGVSVGVGAIHRLFQSNDEFACLVVRERKGCVASGHAIYLGVGQSPKDCVFIWSRGKCIPWLVGGG